MAHKNLSVYGIYPDIDTARDAQDAFRASGFREGDLAVMTAENVGTKDIGHERNSKAPEGGVVGGVTGGVLGALFGWAVSSASLVIPGMEQLAQAAPLVAGLSGMGAGLALGGITGALAGFAKPEYEAKRYSGRVRRNGALYSVHCDDNDWAENARRIMRKTGAEHISIAHEGRVPKSHQVQPIASGRTLHHS